MGNNQFKKTFLIPKFNFGGHYLEYITHIYRYALDDNYNNFVFLLSSDYKEFFVARSNISVVILPDSKLLWYHRAKGIYMRDFFENILIREFVKKHSVSDVLLITLVDVQRFLPFFTLPSVRYIGIIYYVYLYKWKGLSLFRKAQEWCIHKLLTKCKNTQICVCNDELAVRVLNRKFATTKFRYIPDPYVPINVDGEDLFKDYHLEGKTVYAHFGALDERKGTIEILRSIDYLTDDAIKSVAFVFAGKISESIRTEFYRLVRNYDHKTTIIVKDEYCSFLYIGALCNKADYILMPYKKAFQSSGMFGYASQFGTPVVALNKYLHKRLVKQYNLGYTINNATAESIASFINDAPQHPLCVPMDYACNNAPYLFCQVLING